MITLHHLEQSRSQRIAWLLEELELDYEVRQYRRDRKTSLAPPELRAVHPLGKSPVITDGDTVVAESGAIIEYLLERHGDGRLQPQPGTPEHFRYRYWMHYAEGSLMPLLVMTLVFRRVEQAPLLVRPIAKAISAQVRKTFLGPNLDANLGFIESELAQRTWFAGEALSAADIQMSFAVEAALSRGGATLPRCRAFVERVHERPAYRRAEARVGALKMLG